jgi:cytidylate kinase
VIAIEGLTGAGKTTVARELAHRHDIPCFNTGILYRGAAAASILRNVAPDEIESFLAEATFQLDVTSADQPLVCVEGTDISPLLQHPEVTRRSTKIGGVAIAIARFEPVYRSLLNVPEIIVEGKGLSTGMASGAEHPFYLTATRAIRAARKHMQAIEMGRDYTLQQSYEDVARGDLRDMHNAGGLLRRSVDTPIIDTSNLGVRQVVDLIERQSGLTG